MRLIKGISSFVLTAVVLLFALTAAISFFSAPDSTGFLGLKGYTVVSGSMEPEFSTGDFVVVKTTPYEKIKKNDVISFTRGKDIVSHRVVEKTAQGLETKGDANNLVDQGVTTSKEYIGKLFFSIPYYGYIIAASQKPLFFAILVGLLGLYVIYAYLSGEKEER
ncbi:MAG: signal peptidase I [Pisciglobus halotolerans]|nr:signal peptidase I [Pisciglobus halotolerans]